jgi:carbamoyl-phosphate synthase large subunit
VTTVLVTGSGGPLGVNLTRSLQRAPEPYRVVGTDANRWHLPLSECDVTYRIPLARERDGYVRALTDIIARESVDMLLPTHPVEVQAVAELGEAGALGDVALALPRARIMPITDDKARTQALLQDAGVPVPRTGALDEPGDVDRAFAELAEAGQPVWVRGSGAPGLGIGGAALPCRDPVVARAWVEHHGGWKGMSASEYLPGANLSWMAAFDSGALVAAGARERLEYVLPHVSPSGITGAPAVSRTVARADVADIGERAVRAVDDAPHGVYFVDLKGDLDDRPRVTEINAGRCGTTILAYTEAGYNFPHLLVQMALGRSPAALDDPNAAVEPDVYWVRTLDCGPAVVRGDAGFDEYPSAGF